MKVIYLTKGQATVVDDNDFERVAKYNWCALWNKNTESYYAYRGIRENGEDYSVLMHRVIMGVTGRHIQVDHIDHDTLNNQRNNLRICTNAQNQANKRPITEYANKPCSSKYKGVRLHKNGKWQARIRVNGKEKHLGYFKTEEAANQMYQRAAKMYYGKFVYNINTDTRVAETNGQ